MLECCQLIIKFYWKRYLKRKAIKLAKKKKKVVTSKSSTGTKGKKKGKKGKKKTTKAADKDKDLAVPGDAEGEEDEEGDDAQGVTLSSMRVDDIEIEKEDEDLNLEATLNETTRNLEEQPIEIMTRADASVNFITVENVDADDLNEAEEMEKDGVQAAPIDLKKDENNEDTADAEG